MKVIECPHYTRNFLVIKLNKLHLQILLYFTPAGSSNGHINAFTISINTCQQHSLVNNQNTISRVVVGVVNTHNHNVKLMGLLWAATCSEIRLNSKFQSIYGQIKKINVDGVSSKIYFVLGKALYHWVLQTQHSMQSVRYLLFPEAVHCYNSHTADTVTQNSTQYCT